VRTASAKNTPGLLLKLGKLTGAANGPRFEAALRTNRAYVTIGDIDENAGNKLEAEFKECVRQEFSLEPLTIPQLGQNGEMRCLALD
jgi:hypothetical protein